MYKISYHKTIFLSFVIFVLTLLCAPLSFATIIAGNAGVLQKVLTGVKARHTRKKINSIFNTNDVKVTLEKVRIKSKRVQISSKVESWWGKADGTESIFLVRTNYRLPDQRKFTEFELFKSGKTLDEQPQIMNHYFVGEEIPPSYGSAAGASVAPGTRYTKESIMTDAKRLVMLSEVNFPRAPKSDFKVTYEVKGVKVKYSQFFDDALDRKKLSSSE